MTAAAVEEHDKRGGSSWLLIDFLFINKERTHIHRKRVLLSSLVSITQTRNVSFAKLLDFHNRRELLGCLIVGLEQRHNLMC